MKVALVTALVLALISLVIIVVVALANAKTTAVPAPAPSVEVEDCDAGDRKKKDVADCGIGVLIDPKKSTAPVVKPTTAKPVPAVTWCVRTATRRC